MRSRNVASVACSLGASMACHCGVSVAGALVDMAYSPGTPPATAQVTLAERHDRQDLAARSVGIAAQRTVFVERPREDIFVPRPAPPASPERRDEVAAEPQPLMAVLAIFALIGYVIGRRGIHRS